MYLYLSWNLSTWCCFIVSLNQVESMVSHPPWSFLDYHKASGQFTQTQMGPDFVWKLSVPTNALKKKKTEWMTMWRWKQELLSPFKIFHDLMDFTSWIARHLILFPICFLYNEVLIFTKLIMVKIHPHTGQNEQLLSHFNNISHHWRTILVTVEIPVQWVVCVVALQGTLT